MAIDPGSAQARSRHGWVSDAAPPPRRLTPRPLAPARALRDRRLRARRGLQPMGAWLTGAVCCSRRCGRDDRRDELEELVVGGASGGRDAVGADAGEAGRGEDHLGGHLGGRAGPWAGLQACRALRACRAAARARRARVARERARDRAARARASTIPRGERAGARCARVVRAASADAVGITQRRSRVRVALWPSCGRHAPRGRRACRTFGRARSCAAVVCCASAPGSCVARVRPVSLCAPLPSGWISA